MPHIIAVSASKTSHRKTVHLHHCRYIRNIPSENRIFFQSIQEANEAGYHLCRCCHPISRYYNKERKLITEFCEGHHYSFMRNDEDLQITSKYDTWKIITNGKEHRLFLYHKNSNPYYTDKKHHSIVPGYHSQAWRSDNVIGYLKYIVEHDSFVADKRSTSSSITPTFRNRSLSSEELTRKYSLECYQNTWHPIKGTKRYKKDQNKKRRLERRKAIQNVYRLIDQLSANAQ